MTAGRAGLVINPYAWTNQRWPDRRRALRGAFAPLGEVVETEDPGALPELLGRWCAEDKQLVAISGGDGTVHAVVNALLDVWTDRALPRLLLLHGGTVGVATRVPGTEPVRQVAALARRGGAVRTRRVEPLLVGGRVAFNFGLGVFADLPAELLRSGDRGPGAVRALGLRTLASALAGGPLAARALAGWKGRVRCDGAPRGSGRLAGLYASALDMGLPGLRGFDRAPRPAGHLRVVTVDAGRRELVVSLVPFALGLRWGVAEGVRVESVRTLELQPSAPGLYMVDGELAPLVGPLQVTAGPALDVVVGVARSL